MCAKPQSIISLKSCDRIETGSSILKANDGSICTFLVEQLTPDGLSVELCSVCKREREANHPPSVLRQGCRVQLILGESPDMIDEIGVSSFPNTRNMLESVLVGCSEGDVFCLVLYSGDDPRPLETCSVVDNTNFTMTIRILRVVTPPRCMHNKSTPLDEDVEDPLSNPTSDWNPNLARFWYFRACFLKERGNWLIHRHSDDRQNNDASITAQCSPALGNWASAFKCYSRGIQLATLARKAFETCPMGDFQEDHFIHRYHSQELAKAAGDSEIVIDLDVPEDLCLNIGEPCRQTIKRLEFGLLLNLALCQLRAGSAYSAAVNCTQALRMDPGWIRLVQSEIYPQFPVGSEPDVSFFLHSHDIAKALYRRAQSYVAVSKWEEAVSDLESAIRLQKLDTAKSGLALSEALLTHARQKMSQDTTKLAERLRNRRNLF